MGARFQVLKDPRVEATQADLQAQFELGMKIRDSMSRLNEAVIEVRDLREQLEDWEKRLTRQEGASEALATARSLKERLTSIEEELMNTKSSSRMMYPPPTAPPRLKKKPHFRAARLAPPDAVPTRQEYEVYDHLSEQLEEQLGALGDLAVQDIPAFNDALRSLDVPAVLSKSPQREVATSGAR
jgi:chromosome segregation ATPase